MKPRIAVFSGPTATIQNSPPLVTSNKARAKYGLPQIGDGAGDTPRFDLLRLQRLAAPVTLYVEQFSAHPLEREAAELYGPPDGYVDAAGTFSKERRGAADVPVYEVTLEPGDGLYPLPYMGRQADGSAWEDAFRAFGSSSDSRQTFYPDASRIFEEIDRVGATERGVGNLLASMAEFDFYRPAPSGGYRKGLSSAQRTDSGDGDIPPEVWGTDFFMYYPFHLRAEPFQGTLAHATNIVAKAMATGEYVGGLWLEGSPTAEESIYWLNLLINTTVPLVAHSAQRAHGLLSADGDRNIVDGVKYLVSRVWAGDDGSDAVGGVMIVDELIFSARDVQKGDARPGGYVATGGHGGILGSANPPKLMFRPNKRHTATSETNLARIPAAVEGVLRTEGGVRLVPFQIKDENGDLLPSAIPKVTIEKYGRYLSDKPDACGEDEVGIMARIERNLLDWPLAGFVGEGMAPYGALNESEDQALTHAIYHGMPVVKVGRGNAEGVAPKNSELFISGDNLTATKARMLLMACLMRFGSLPPPADPTQPQEEELKAIKAKVAQYQSVFDTH